MLFPQPCLSARTEASKDCQRLHTAEHRPWSLLQAVVEKEIVVESEWGTNTAAVSAIYFGKCQLGLSFTLGFLLRVDFNREKYDLWTSKYCVLV